MNARQFAIALRRPVGLVVVGAAQAVLALQLRIAVHERELS